MSEEKKTLCCDRCGLIFEGEEDEHFCEVCRLMMEVKASPREHITKHMEQPDLDTAAKKKEHRKRAMTSEAKIRAVVKLGDKNGLSYGKTMAAIREGKL